MEGERRARNGPSYMGPAYHRRTGGEETKRQRVVKKCLPVALVPVAGVEELLVRLCKVRRGRYASIRLARKRSAIAAFPEHWMEAFRFALYKLRSTSATTQRGLRNMRDHLTTTDRSPSVLGDTHYGLTQRSAAPTFLNAGGPVGPWPASRARRRTNNTLALSLDRARGPRAGRRRTRTAPVWRQPPHRPRDRGTADARLRPGANPRRADHHPFPAQRRGRDAGHRTEQQLNVHSARLVQAD